MAKEVNNNIYITAFLFYNNYFTSDDAQSRGASRAPASYIVISDNNEFLTRWTSSKVIRIFHGKIRHNRIARRGTVVRTNRNYNICYICMPIEVFFNNHSIQFSTLIIDNCNVPLPIICYLYYYGIILYFKIT